MSLSSLQVSLTSSSAIPIASRTGDGRGATSRPSGGDADDGDASEGEDATAVPAVVQMVVPVAVQAAGHPAACQGLEPPA
jgi:hypothetical protein